MGEQLEMSWFAGQAAGTQEPRRQLEPPRVRRMARNSDLLPRIWMLCLFDETHQYPALLRRHTEVRPLAKAI